MKKFYNFILTIPLLNLFLIYFYIGFCTIVFGYPEFYYHDPKKTPISFLYNPIAFFSIIDIFIFIPIGLMILLIELFSNKKTVSPFFKMAYWLGILLTIFTYVIDIKGLQFWFYD